MDLFEQEKRKDEGLPLAVRMRPRSLDEFVGQSHVLDKGKILRRNVGDGGLLPVPPLGEEIAQIGEVIQVFANSAGGEIPFHVEVVLIVFQGRVEVDGHGGVLGAWNRQLVKCRFDELTPDVKRVLTVSKAPCLWINPLFCGKVDNL